MASAAAREPDLLDPPEASCDTCGMVDCQCERSPAEAGAQPGTAAVLDPATLAAIGGSPAIAAFIHRRLEQAVRHGHSPAKDRDQPPFWLPREAHSRLVAVLDEIGRDQGGPARSPDHLARRRIALKRLEIAGALMMAGHDVLRAIIERDTAAAAAMPADPSST